MFALGIPTLNRYDLLKEALDKYVIDFPGVEIHVVDNGNQGIEPPKNVTVHLMPENLGVAASWNFLLKTIFKKHKVAIILNDDVYWGRDKQQVFEYIRTWVMKGGIQFSVSQKTWCSFLITKDVFKAVGEFDENFFPAYFEDNDFSRRMSLDGICQAQDVFMNPIIYRNSMTLERDKTINNNFMKNKNYYISKWGGEPGKEIFVIPFGK